MSDILERSPARISQAARNGEPVKGYQIDDWAEFGPTGQVKGYTIPAWVKQAASDRLLAEGESVESFEDGSTDFKLPFASTLRSSYSVDSDDHQTLGSEDPLNDDEDESESGETTTSGWDMLLGASVVWAGLWLLGQLANGAPKDRSPISQQNRRMNAPVDTRSF